MIQLTIVNQQKLHLLQLLADVRKTRIPNAQHKSGREFVDILLPATVQPASSTLLAP
jgi:hypothetical protein